MKYPLLAYQQALRKKWGASLPQFHYELFEARREDENGVWLGRFGFQQYVKHEEAAEFAHDTA